MLENLFQKKIILGSASPRRRQLLREIIPDFEVRQKDVDESFPHRMKREEIALYLAEKKASAFEPEMKTGEILITADTIVWLDKQVLNKPAGRDDAIRMLKLLSGNIHEVYTAVCVSNVYRQELFYVKSEVQFHTLTNEEIFFYVDHYQPFDKAGSYGAQDCLPVGMNPCSGEEQLFLALIGKPYLFEETLASKKNAEVEIITHINGSYFNVMGLPVRELYQTLTLF